MAKKFDPSIHEQNLAMAKLLLIADYAEAKARYGDKGAAKITENIEENASKLDATNKISGVKFWLEAYSKNFDFNKENEYNDAVAQATKSALNLVSDAFKRFQKAVKSAGNTYKINQESGTLLEHEYSYFGGLRSKPAEYGNGKEFQSAVVGLDEDSKINILRTQEFFAELIEVLDNLNGCLKTLGEPESAAAKQLKKEIEETRDDLFASLSKPGAEMGKATKGFTIDR